MGKANLLEEGTYFIQSNRHLDHVLACSDAGKICVTPNKVKEGWEGTVLQSFLFIFLII